MADRDARGERKPRVRARPLIGLHGARPESGPRLTAGLQSEGPSVEEPDMTATQSLQSIYRQSLSATVLCWLIDRVPGPTKCEWLGLLGAALRVVAVASCW